MELVTSIEEAKISRRLFGLVNRTSTRLTPLSISIGFVEFKDGAVCIEIPICKETVTEPAIAESHSPNFKPDVGGREVTNSSDKENVNTGYYYLNES